MTQKDNAAKQPDKKSSSLKEEGENALLFNKNITLMADTPLPHLDKGKTIKAYRAVGKNKIVSELFVLVCDKALSPRHISSIKYTKIANANLPKLVDSGKIFWPPAQEERFVLIYENTLGAPLWQDAAKIPALAWKPDDVLNNVAYPMIAILNDMRDKDIVHGEIWPGNMFFPNINSTSLQKGEVVKLGECLSVPSSYHLPALYEPIERALSQPIGRGTGLLTDDIYSFGVSLAVMLRSSDPLKGLSDEEIVNLKVEKGSYATLIGKDRLSGALLELLRGLLYDDPIQRWTLEDIQAWADGRRLSPKQSPKRVLANRPLEVANKKYTRPEVLAKELWRSPDEVAKIFENGDLEQWIERAIEDKLLKARIENVSKEINASDRSLGFNERLSVLLASALYTECPVRYKNLSFIPSGFAKALSHAYITKQDMQPYVDVLRYNFTISAIRQRKKIIDTQTLIAKLDSCRSLIGQSGLSKGIERCLYLMDTECHCLSPILDKYFVQTPEQMMQAFEEICKDAQESQGDKGLSQLSLFDKHTVAYLSVKDRKNIDPYMSELDAPEPHRRVLGQLRTLATIQKRENIKKLPALCHWIANNLEPIYERFHDADKRAHLLKQIESLKTQGDLTKLALLFDDPNLYQLDKGAFYQAMNEYKRIDKERLFIETQLNTRTDFGQNTGAQVASAFSMFISILLILLAAYFIIIKG